MLDIKFIRQNKKEVEQSLKNKGAKIDLDRLLEIDEKRRLKIKEVDELRAGHNRASEEIASLGDEEKENRIAEVKGTKQKLVDMEFELSVLEEEFNSLMYQVPNVPLAGVPIGKDEHDNIVLREVGEKQRFDFEPRDYIELGEKLDLIDTARAAKISGSRFGYLKREAPLLEFALIQFAFNTLTSEANLRSIADSISAGYPAKPFIPVVPPVMIRPDVFRKMARLSDADKNERYYLPQDDLYLVGSAEHTMGSLHMEETLDEKELPLRYVGFSTCFRREAGSYGKDTRGILRVHQFDKIEMESFTVGDVSVEEQNFFVGIQEHLMTELGIPYRVVAISTGDMGGPDARQIDIEAWLPGQNMYRETHTADLMTDYQARRLNTKVKRKSGTVEFAHMNDATVFAIGRTIIAILENYQQVDGSVRVPEVLQPYMFGIKEIKR
ncbi:MAG: serine--tRNA ligase [Candidatus Sungbacteria bacterium]|nr:serine--tRNA ligase [Candidatus Sungbacteria bacterium]